MPRSPSIPSVLRKKSTNHKRFQNKVVIYVSTRVVVRNLTEQVQYLFKIGHFSSLFKEKLTICTFFHNFHQFFNFHLLYGKFCLGRVLSTHCSKLMGANAPPVLFLTLTLSRVTQIYFMFKITPILAAFKPESNREEAGIF